MQTVMRVPTFMVIPSLNCQASCKYCFGPHVWEIMDVRAAGQVALFIQRIARECNADRVSIVFHGGEPLLAPMDVWEVLLTETRRLLKGVRVDFSVQSNLWNLTDELLRLFRTHRVSIGTSLDGPRALCDANRGAGYFDRTREGMRRAAADGREVSAIATLTRQTRPHVVEIAQFFRDEGVPLVLHGAVDGLGAGVSSHSLDAQAFGEALMELFPWYINNRKAIQIDTLDHFVRGMMQGDPGVCTLRDCLGMFLAIGPTGDITSCQRLAGRDAFRLGNVFDMPSLQALMESPPAIAQREREQRVSQRCAECAVVAVCKGGCYYNALANGSDIDPLCEAYKTVYAHVQEHLMREMQSPENRAVVSMRPPVQGEHLLMRVGAYTSLGSSVHPAIIADNARRILAVHALCKHGEPASAAKQLRAEGITGDVPATTQLLLAMQSELKKPNKPLNNCYIHLTFDCNLRCTHCYASGGERSGEMRPEHFRSLVREAIDAGFRQLVVTGGEPRMHAQWFEILRICSEYLGKGAHLILRTNLTGDIADDELAAIAGAFDQVVVSVDGNEQTHDHRRGAGSYADMLINIEAYQRIRADISRGAELSLACVMGAADINGSPGRSVRQLGERLGVRRVRFRPLLPIGRAADMEEPVMCEGLMQHVAPAELLEAPFRPLTSCGIGQNLYIKPDGGAHPCYAWCHEGTFLGNVIGQGLQALLDDEAFSRLRGCTVDTIAVCRDCEYRYLCGGACRAWGNRDAHDVNAPPAACDHLKHRARALLDEAHRFLKEG